MRLRVTCVLPCVLTGGTIDGAWPARNGCWCVCLMFFECGGASVFGIGDGGSEVRKLREARSSLVRRLFRWPRREAAFDGTASLHPSTYQIASLALHALSSTNRRDTIVLHYAPHYRLADR